MRKVLLRAGALIAILTWCASPGVGGVQAAAVDSPSAHGLTAGVSGAAIVQYAMRFLGYPYTTVGNSPSTGFSCIGFVSYVYQSNGIQVPDDLGGAYNFAPQVSFADLEPGDVLFFQNTVWPGLSHTAIYIGGGRFIHAEWYNRGVVISSFTNDPVDYNYWTEHYLGANRPWIGPAAAPVTAAAPTSSAPAPVRENPVVPVGPSARVQVFALNVRFRPSMASPIKTVVDQGSRVVIRERWLNWYGVVLPDGQFGWVIGAGIGKGAVQPRLELVKQSTATVAAVQATVVAQVSGLRVHTRPGVAAPVLTSLGLGQHLGLLQTVGGWTQVRLSSGATGWVSSAYVGSHAGSSARRAVTPARSGQTATASVALNVRSGPSLRHAIKALLVPGQTYSILGSWNGWAYVALASGGSGWIKESVLGGRVSRPSVAASGPVITAGVRLHWGAGLSRPVIGLVAAGTRVQILGTRGPWVRVRLPGGRTGYVLGTYVSR